MLLKRCKLFVIKFYCIILVAHYLVSEKHNWVPGDVLSKWKVLGVNNQSFCHMYISLNGFSDEPLYAILNTCKINNVFPISKYNIGVYLSM